MDRPFIRRVTIQNFKSIAWCRIDLEQMMFLVGPNGAGKSNFLDALRFVADALRTTLDLALRDRGTIKEVRRRSGGHPTHFFLRFDFEMPSGGRGHYAFRIGSKRTDSYEVQTEECQFTDHGTLEPEHFFHVSSGRVAAASFAELSEFLCVRRGSVSPTIGRTTVSDG
jgi:predicted ATPase